MIVQTLTTKRCQKVVKPVNHEPIMTKPYREKNKSHKLRNFLQSPFNLIFLNHLRSIRSKKCFICTRESPDFAHSFQIRHIYAAKTLAPVFSLLPLLWCGLHAQNLTKKRSKWRWRSRNNYFMCAQWETQTYKSIFSCITTSRSLVRGERKRNENCYIISMIFFPS